MNTITLISLGWIMGFLWIMKRDIHKEMDGFAIGMKGHIERENQILRNQMSTMVVETSIIRNIVASIPGIIQQTIEQHLLKKVIESNVEPVFPEKVPYTGKKRGPKPGVKSKTQIKKILSEKGKARWASYSPEKRSALIEKMRAKSKVKKAAQDEQPTEHASDAVKYAKALVGGGL